jgi:hypothetical protein
MLASSFFFYKNYCISPYKTIILGGAGAGHPKAKYYKKTHLMAGWPGF